MIAAVAGLGGMSHSHGGVLLPLAAVAALLFLLHRSRSGRGLAGPGRPATRPERRRRRPQDATGTTAERRAMTPPAWDPLGAAPFAWDLPEPGPVARSRAAAAARGSRR